MKRLSAGFAKKIYSHRDRISTLFLILTLILGSLETYACRYDMNPDSMDYLDIARQIAEGHWNAVANGYWGTLNSILLAPLFLFRLSPALELELAHLQGILILLLAFFSFRFFLHTCIDVLYKSVVIDANPFLPLPEWALCMLGYGLFLWSSLALVPVSSIGPDLLVTVFIYLATAILLRLHADSPFRYFLLLGVVLGIGYWAKAIMFPIGLTFLGVSILKVPRWKQNLVSVLAFSIATAPLLAALSVPRGRFTFGDSGKLAYSSLVSPGGRVINWQGVPVASGTPKHPTRKIGEDLPIYEFNGPIVGTYPPSYDPSYWNEGRKTTFNLKAQVMTFARYSRSVIEILFVTQPSLTAGFLFLFFWKPRPFLHNFLRRWDLLVLSAVIICLYMLVYLTPRYIGAFVVLLWFSGFMALRVLANEESHRVAGLSVIALVIAMVLSLTSDIAKKIVNGSPDSAFSHVEMAQQLMLPPDTAVAVVGRANFAYWAHLTQIRIVADIMATEEAAFWRLPADKRQELYIAFRTTGAQWIIAEPQQPVSADTLDKGWEQIGTTTYYRYRLKQEFAE